MLTGFGNEERYIDALMAKYPASEPISLSSRSFEERVIERATPFDVTPELRIRTYSAEDLIVLKLFASRPLDVS